MPVFQNVLEEKIADAIDKPLISLGYEIVRVKVINNAQNNKIIQIMFERVDQNPVSIDDCEKANKLIAPILEIEEIITERYNLEVSSPGVDKPLTRHKDFVNSVGSVIKCTTFLPIANRRRFVGRLASFAAGILTLELDDAQQIQITQKEIQEASLIPENIKISKIKKQRQSEDVMAVVNFGGIEVLQIIEAVSREKNISREKITLALEEALQISARRKYGYEYQIRAQIDRKTGEIRLYKEILVVETQEEADLKYAEEQIQTITLEDARLKNANIVAGDILCEALPAMDIGRIAAQSAKQVITTKVREIEKELQYEEFKDRIGEIINGVVEKAEYGNLIVRLGSAEAIIRRDNLLRADTYKQGDRIRAHLLDIDREAKGPQLILSRTSVQFLTQLFAQEVPEIYENIIQVKAVSRDPGSRAKIAVYSSDPGIDAVGSCVGMRGSRVQAVMAELKGEKIDIIQWSSDIGTLIVNALAPASISKVLIDEEQHKVEVIVPEEQQSIAIGRQGQNVRLASQLIHCRLDILTESKESKRRQDEFNAITQKFMEAMDLEEILAQLLASEGYNSIQSIIEADIENLSNIQGLDIDIAKELIGRAKEYAKSHKDAEEIIVPSYVQDIANSPLLKIKEITAELAQQLHHAGIDTMIDVADLSRDDFLDLFPDTTLEHAKIDSMIMDARKKTYFSNKI